ncbi:MAG: hypothetical protein E7256_18010 [Lachnospiraceae bacterium]|nr:hypothetical protein [Lachnospiraceae bacterium]
MGIPIITQLKEQIEQVGIAGFTASAENFRLQKAVDELERNKSKSPVLNKIYQKAATITEQIQNEDPAGFLETMTLVDAVDLTQADLFHASEEEILPIKENEQKETEEKSILHCNSTYREIACYKELLTNRGSGRYVVLQNAYEEENPVLNDYRMIPYIIGALSDPYGEIADLAAKIAVRYGTCILPLVKESANLKRKRDMQRRVELISSVAGEAEAEQFLASLK